MARPSPRQRKPSVAARQRRSGATPPWRTVAAVLLVLAGLAGLGVLVWRATTPGPPETRADPGALVREVAARHGCAPERVLAQRVGTRREPLWTVTVHAPRPFDVANFELDLEAAAHNAGGRLEPRPLGERGGYGLSRLDGIIDGQRVRVLVLGEPPPPTPRTRPRSREVHAPQAELAIVLDDAGNSLDPLPALERLPKAVAVAVLPNAAQSREVARALGATGRELLVHMPMEPVPNHGPGPGPGAVEVGLSGAEIEARVAAALDVVAGARGLNNHMGSRATADRAAMTAVMRALKSRGIYFLDSRTSPETVAEEAARAAGVPTLRRDVFLDVTDDPEEIRAALRSAAARARADGRAVAIGHVHPTTIDVLAAELPTALDGVELVRPSRLAR